MDEHQRKESAWKRFFERINEKRITASKKLISFVRLLLILVPLLVFQLAVLGACVGLILRAWPDNRWARAIATHEQSIRFATEITRDRQELLTFGRAGILRWRNVEATDRTTADTALVAKADGYATVLISLYPAGSSGGKEGAAGKTSPSGASTGLTTQSDLNHAEARLTQAQSLLARRQNDIRRGLETQAPPVCQLPLARLFCVSSDPLQGIPFTPDEQADLAQRQADAPPLVHAQLLGSKDLDYFLLLAAFGALGAVVQSFASLGRYLGERKFVTSWTLFYLFRPLVGAGVATALYLIIRAGMASGMSMDVTNIYVVSALAILVGLFSGEAMEKLKVVATAVFETNEGKDSLAGKLPVIVNASIKPNSDDPLGKGNTGWLLEIVGLHIPEDSHVLVNRVMVEQGSIRMGEAKPGEERTVCVWLPADDPQILRGVVQVMVLTRGGGLSKPFTAEVTLP
jgi:hypothetical protein